MGTRAFAERLHDKMHFSEKFASAAKKRVTTTSEWTRPTKRRSAWRVCVRLGTFFARCSFCLLLVLARLIFFAEFLIYYHRLQSMLSAFAFFRFDSFNGTAFGSKHKLSLLANCFCVRSGQQWARGTCTWGISYWKWLYHKCGILQWDCYMHSDGIFHTLLNYYYAFRWAGISIRRSPVDP